MTRAVWTLLVVPMLGLPACIGRVAVEADALDTMETSAGDLFEGSTGSTGFTGSTGSTQEPETTSSGDDDGWWDDGVSCGAPYVALCPVNLDCDPWGQDCPRGEKCSPLDNSGDGVWNTTRCTPLEPDPSAVGESCQTEGSVTSGVDTCELGAVCWAVDRASLVGTCVQQCIGNAANSHCPEGTACMIANDGVLTLCLPSCEPLRDACDEGFTCRPTHTRDTFVCLPDDARGIVPDT